MGLIDWLKSLLRPRPVVRDVSELAAEQTSDDAAVTRETVRTSGEPLKPQHRRRALRDPRLLPKPKKKPSTFPWPRSKRPKILATDEAARLFSATLRTRDRTIRDLATDARQLELYGLPIWEKEEDLAAALGISVGRLRHYSIHRSRETSPHYVTFAVPKRSGGQRLIHAPKQRLKALQRRLHELLVSRLPISAAAHGFRPGRSVATNASAHVGRAVVVRMDLKDCFPSIHFGRVRGLLIALGYNYPVATTLAVLMTEAPRQPVEIEDQVFHVPVGPRVCAQGAPTSPGLCNAVLTRLDHRLTGLARKLGFVYTRYADDLTFSGDATDQIRPLLAIASRIIRNEGFAVNRQKTRVLRQARRQVVAGVVVNQQVGLSRVERRRLRAAIHQLGRNPDTDRSKEIRRLRGKLAYLKMLNPAQAAPLIEAIDRATGDAS